MRFRLSAHALSRTAHAFWSVCVASLSLCIHLTSLLTIVSIICYYIVYQTTNILFYELLFPHGQILAVIWQNEFVIFKI